ncbi:hypothetical protein [Nocardiopsis composta]|uniref:Uncharacterized protein n=1 Tax=Nocardiopsis composta TaxID=157465 RepID=A0A7W8QPE6_9ACTN|nr:hypothetical protein [Nocardiopsis composta]MBB5433443.1 hypothetical protein [Nocardiopsis composta]
MSVDMGDRWRFTSALLGEDAAPPPDGPSPRVVRGVVLDVSRHMLVLATPEGEERFLFEEATRFWRGREAAPRELRLGDDVLARCAPGGRWVVDRVWARLGRVTGTITEVDGETVRVDPGHGRPAATAVVPYRSSGRMAVRHPNLRPGYLFDAIGLRRDGVVEASVPATTQAPYPVHRSPHRPPVRTMPPAVSAIVTWYDPAAGRAAHDDPRALLLGAAYPALDSGDDCGPGCDRTDPCLPLPRLSIGVTLTLTNDETGERAAVPVIDCASALSRFCDRCRDSGAEARGRLAELTLPSFVALGGRPEAGCLPATLRVG